MPIVALALLAAAAFVYLNGGNMGSSPKAGTGSVDRKAFVDRLRPIAYRIQLQGGVAPDGTKVLPGIHADLGVVQAGHESGWGASELARGRAQNIFGMTAELGTYWRSQKYPFVEMPTKEWSGAGKEYATVRPFRAYANWEASYLDWARRIQKPDFVEVRVAAERGDLKGFAAALRKVGYATDPSYEAKILSSARAVGLA